MVTKFLPLLLECCAEIILISSAFETTLRISLGWRLVPVHYENGPGNQVFSRARGMRHKTDLTKSLAGTAHRSGEAFRGSSSSHCGYL